MFLKVNYVIILCIKEWIKVIILAIIFLLLGICCFGYYISSIVYSGLDTDFIWFWLASAIACVFLAILLSYLHGQKVEVNKYISIIFFSLLIFASSFFVFLEGMILYKGNSIPSKNADYVIVLGAQVKGSALSRALKSRLDTAIGYLEENIDSKVIVSGGQGRGEDISEALAMKTYLISKGIADSRIIMEDKSTNTEENIRFSQTMIADKNRYIVIVTNKFHVYRATMIAKKQEMTKVKGLGASTDDILVVHYHVREFFALVKDKLIGNI